MADIETKVREILTKNVEGHNFEIAIPKLLTLIQERENEARKKALNDMFQKIASLAEPDEGQFSAGELVTHMDEIFKIYKDLIPKSLRDGS